MAFFDALRSRAASLTQVFDRQAGPKLSKDELFRNEYKLPDNENIIDDSNAEISLYSTFNKEGHKTNNMIDVYQGRLYLTQHFLIFRDAYDKKSCSFVLHLSTIKKVERLPSRAYLFALSIQTYSGLTFTIQFIGIRSSSEQFSHNLKIQLKKNLSNIKQLRPFLETLYSEYLLSKNNSTDEKVLQIPVGGLGLDFKYPGNAKLLRDKAKMKLWFDFFRSQGRNLTVVKDQLFYKLIRVGLPNRLRGEIWELCCGSMYLRLNEQSAYRELLIANEGRQSLAIEEIEKDLNRSLPEYPAYQDEEGINRLRRVLTAYSWKNPDVGYCQAMNIVVAALLIYMSEEQAFWALNVLCDKMVPGYYSKTMYGTLLDQKVFESLVEKTMPILWQHISENDIQLSVVSLPWFLSLFLSSMPLVFAFRIVDVFFLQGPKTLFQVALAILRINGEELLKTGDDGTFISIIKDYFQTLDQSAHPNSPNEKYKSITKFQELLVVSFKEFSIVTDEMINQQRDKYKSKIFQDIEIFVKRTQIRNLPKTPNLSTENLSKIYDRFYSIVESYQARMGVGSTLMDYKSFRRFMIEICEWIDYDLPMEDDEREPAKDFVYRLFDNWDSEKDGTLTLNDLAVGLDRLVEPDLMTALSNFFDLYDTTGEGKIDKDGILKMSEDLLFLSSPWRDGYKFDGITQTLIENIIADKIVEQQKESDCSDTPITIPAEIDIDKTKLEHLQIERYLSAASTFIQRSFEYAQPEEVLIELEDHEDQGEEQSNDSSEKISQVDKDSNVSRKEFTITHNAALDPNKPMFINLPTYRMVILADETYELFFTETLRNSININRETSNRSNTRNLRDMFDGLLADGRKVASKVKRRMDDASNGFANMNLNDNSSIKSTKSRKVADEDEDDDFGSTSINDIDKDLLLNGAEVQVLSDIPLRQNNSREREDRNMLHGRDMDSEIAAGIDMGMGKNESVVEFATS